jgi:hypothetical protein
LKHPPWHPYPSSGVRLDSQAIVHRELQLLLAAEVLLRRLNRDVSKQELNLVQLSANVVDVSPRSPTRRGVALGPVINQVYLDPY